MEGINLAIVSACAGRHKAVKKATLHKHIRRDFFITPSETDVTILKCLQVLVTVVNLRSCSKKTLPHRHRIHRESRKDINHRPCFSLCLRGSYSFGRVQPFLHYRTVNLTFGFKINCLNNSECHRSKQALNDLALEEVLIVRQTKNGNMHGIMALSKVAECFCGHPAFDVLMLPRQRHPLRIFHSGVEIYLTRKL